MFLPFLTVNEYYTREVDTSETPNKWYEISPPDDWEKHYRVMNLFGAAAYKEIIKTIDVADLPPLTGDYLFVNIDTGVLSCGPDIDLKLASKLLLESERTILIEHNQRLFITQHYITK